MRRILLALAIVGCGSDTGTGSAGDHALVMGQYQEIAAGTVYGYPFSVPSTATVRYSIVGRSTTSPDTINVGIFTPQEYAFFQNGQNGQALPGTPNNNVSNATGSGTAAAGSYTLGIRCTNVIEKCQLTFDLIANY